MDLHPLFIHFPIALLSVYSFLELIRYFAAGARWTHTRGVLVITGVIGAFMSLSTGETAEHLFKKAELHAVLEIHSLLANVTTWVYAILAAAYLLLWLQGTTLLQSVPQGFRTPISIGMRIASVITSARIAPVLATLGFLGLLMVGSLGAILVYGPDFDPVTSFMYRLFFGG
ncbi:hypothetical protein K8942_04365 [Candidatus Peribacteria bacterium]|nr:MAG: hypothetical protein K8942_04365 [Candidatus Peribacteria bacterium]